MIFGISIYYILLDFLIFAFAGWVYECTFVFLRDHKPINRGFLIGPVIPIYGVGAVVVYVLLRPVSGMATVLYFSGSLVATAIEYVTAWILETFFHTKWWDYSEEPYNFKGRVALIPSMFWGVLSLVMFDVFQPIVTKIIEFIPHRTGQVIIVVAYFLLSVDLVYTVITMINFHKQLEKIYEIRNSIDYHLAEMSENSIKELLKYSVSELSDKMKFIKKNPWLGNRRIMDAFPKMKIISKGREYVSVRELVANMRDKTENLGEQIKKKKEEILIKYHK